MVGVRRKRSWKESAFVQIGDGRVCGVWFVLLLLLGKERGRGRGGRRKRRGLNTYGAGGEGSGACWSIVSDIVVRQWKTSMEEASYCDEKIRQIRELLGVKDRGRTYGGSWKRAS